MAFDDEIVQWRDKLDIIDGEILDALARRFQVIDEVTKLKKKYDVPSLQLKRWNEILGRMIVGGKENNLSRELVKDIWNRIHEEALKIENGK